MDKKEILETITKLRASSKKRKFQQTFDLIINLKGLDLKKEDQKILTFLKLPHTKGKKVKVTALVGKELSTKAKEACDNVILKDNFRSLEKKEIKKIASKTDFFIAQANVMPDVAKAFGRVLGPRGLMPNPKAGCVLPPTGEVKPIVANLQKTVRLETKNELTVKTAIGTEEMKDEEIADNALAIYNSVLHSLPQEKNNIVNSILKLTMSKPFVIGAKEEPKQEKPKEEKKPAEVKKAPKEEPKKKQSKKKPKKEVKKK